MMKLRVRKNMRGFKFRLDGSSKDVKWSEIIKWEGKVTVQTPWRWGAYEKSKLKGRLTKYLGNRVRIY